MKTLILTLFLSTCVNLGFSQEPVSNDYVVSPEDRSIVYIINDQMGKLIYNSWKNDPVYNGFRPIVILVDDLEKYRSQIIKKTKSNNYDNRTSTKREE